MLYSPRAAKCVKRLKLDIIHTQSEFSLGMFGKIMARQMGIPVVHTYHTLWKDYFYYISKGKFKKFSDNLVKVLSRNYCNGCDLVIVPTLKVYDILKEYGTETPIKVIPTGVDLKRFESSNYTQDELIKLKESVGIKRDDPVIVFVGRVAKEKSIDVILNQLPAILKKVPDAKFLVVGDGPYLEELKVLAKELNIADSVICTGEQPWEMIGKFYMLGNVFISSSVTETQGLTIIEAMAADTPVIVKEDRNIERLIIDKYNGRVFKSDNEIPYIVEEIFKNRDMSSELVQHARNTVREYSIEHFGESIEQLYYKVIETNTNVKRKTYGGLKGSKTD